MNNSPESAPDQLTTMLFDREDEYVRFVDHVFEQFQGRALEFTNMPIPISLCVKPWLLQRTQDQFAMHPATETEVAEARRALRTSGRKAFDPADIVNFHIPEFL